MSTYRCKTSLTLYHVSLRNLLSYTSSITIGKAHGWGTFPKCRVGLDYLILWKFIWTLNPTSPRAKNWWIPPSHSPQCFVLVRLALISTGTWKCSIPVHPPTTTTTSSSSSIVVLWLHSLLILGALMGKGVACYGLYGTCVFGACVGGTTRYLA